MQSLQPSNSKAELDSAVESVSNMSTEESASHSSDAIADTNTSSYRLLIADDHPLFREAIAGVIRNRYPHADIIEAENLDDAAAIAEEQDDIDLILLDLNMPGMNGLNGLIQLRNESPTIPVVIISAEEEKSVVLQAMTYGAVGFIIKSLPREKMTQALEQVLAGQVYLPSDVIRASDDGRSRQKRMNEENQIPPEMLNSLTRRQLLVLERMANGESNKQIAYNLSIAETTVKAHVSAILRKLGVHNRIQAVLAASHVDFNQYLRR